MNKAALPRLERILLQEIRIYEGYNALTTLEKSVVSPFNAAKVSDAAVRREQFLEEMTRLSEERRRVAAEIFGESKLRLREQIKEFLRGDEQRRFLALAEKLMATASISQKDTRELNSIVRFGMGMVDGLLSIFWSATQNVTKNYTRLGGIKESATPAGGRASSVLKKA